jgi:hypothetical protein
LRSRRIRADGLDNAGELEIVWPTGAGCSRGIFQGGYIP